MCKVRKPMFYVNGGDNLVKVNRYKRERDWKYEIRKLAVDFCRSDMIDGIIASVMSATTGTETEYTLYNRAWRKLLDTI